MVDDEEEESYSAMKELVMEDMKSFFRPEFINRLDELVVFRSLTKDNVRAIAEVEFQQVLARLGESDLDVVLTQAFKDRVVDQGYDPAFGARPLRRAISTMLEDTLAEHLLQAASASGEGQDEQDDKAMARQSVE